METIESDDVDPRRVRSRQRLLDAAVTLLNSGGVEAVTVEAVTRLSRVARTTLYRHFESSTDLVAAASYCQDLWMGEFQAASSESELGSGSTSLPFSKVAPSRTSFTRCGALTARHFDWAASINL